MYQVNEGSAELCQEPPGWPRAASFCSMEFTCNIESTSHSLDRADQQQKVNIVIYNHIYSYGHLPVITGYKWDYTFYKWGYKYL